MTTTVTEDEMLRRLCADVKRRYPKKILADPDYRRRAFYGSQWRCLAGVYYWKLKDDLEPILAAFSKARGVFLVSESGLELDAVKELLPEGVKT